MIHLYAFTRGLRALPQIGVGFLAGVLAVLVKAAVKPGSAEWKDASTPSCPPMAQPTCGVALSIPRISISALHQPPVERSL